jgi:hypothetical protein
MYGSVLSHNRVSLGLLPASAAYIRELDDRYGSPGFLAALDAAVSGLRTSSGDGPKSAQMNFN